MADVWQSLLAGLGSGLSSGTQAYQQADQARKQQGLDQLKMAISMGDRNLAAQAMAQAYAPDPLSRLLFGEKPMGYVAPKQSVPTQPAAQPTAIPVSQALATTPQPAANPMAALLGTPTPIDASLAGGPMVVQPPAIAPSPAPTTPTPAQQAQVNALKTLGALNGGVNAMGGFFTQAQAPKAKAKQSAKPAAPVQAPQPAPQAVAAQPSPVAPAALAAPTTPPVSNATPSMWLDEHTVNPEWVDRYVMPHALPGEAELATKYAQEAGVKNFDASNLTPTQLTEAIDLYGGIAQTNAAAKLKYDEKMADLGLKKQELKQKWEIAKLEAKTKEEKNRVDEVFHQLMVGLEGDRVKLEGQRVTADTDRQKTDKADRDLTKIKHEMATPLNEQIRGLMANAATMKPEDLQKKLTELQTKIEEIDTADSKDDLKKILAEADTPKATKDVTIDWSKLQ